ncbi:serine/threonine protein kinase [Streptomyces sp. OF3]|uniref:Serine/threonine protein kinase n=1 Tax=Streptomyces alkaliterrae TaxID=2213162 RepID=A0A7W3ZN39_9ACTN|nr:protein kinase [Streptomyces alkaliterrae]MBB1254171.1 serine/threonine protein kinase [Streptomyces alkaliterrae]
MDALRPADPEHIGRYVLLGRLGAGGMGQVYLGRSPGGRLVALKVIRDEFTDRLDAFARFRREVETVQLVRSAYTASLIDANLVAAPYWLATEYVSGPTLSRAVAARGPIPIQTCLGVFAGLAEGLAAVHSFGVTHRDLKPQNVMFSAQGPQLIDFGIARGEGQAALTETGYAPGTPGFTAPEVLLNNEVGPRADVFALGATMAYAATGRPPFGNGEAAGVSYRAVHETIDVDGVDTQLATLIRACVEKKPSSRPQLQEVIAHCSVQTALAEDPTYAALAALTVPVTQVPPGSHRDHGGPAVHGLAIAHAATQTALPPAPRLHQYTPTQASTPTLAKKRRPWLQRTSAALGGAILAVGTVLLIQALTDAKQDERPASERKQDGGRSKPPKYIDSYSSISRDFWESDPSKLSGGECNLPTEERPDGDLLVSIAPKREAGRMHIAFRFKYVKDTTEGYYVSVAVKPPHEIDPRTDKPFRFDEGRLQQNLNLGYTSEPIDLNNLPDRTGEVKLVYPDDFTQWVDGDKQASKGIPLRNDPGDWTVQLMHVKSPTEFSSIYCSGFTWR